MLHTLKYLFLIFTIVACQNTEQISYPEYYRAFNEINEDLNSNKIDLAISKFESLQNRVKHIPSRHLFKIARKCAEHNLCELSAKYLKKSFLNGYEYTKETNPNKAIINCSEAVNETLKFESEFHNFHFNYEYKSLIDSMFQIDQKLRMGSDLTKMKLIDSLNMISLLHQVEKFGFPSEKLIGHKSASRAFILFLHMDRDKNNKVFKPILDNAYNKGYLDPISYAWIVDRRRAWGDEELEPYYYHMPSKNYDSFNTEQINEINRRRDSIGMEAK